MVIKSMTDTKRSIRCMALITVEFTPGFDWVHVAKCLVFCVVLCRSLFVLFSRDVFIFDHCIVYPSSITASKYTFCNKAFLIGIDSWISTTYMQSVPFTSKVVSSNPVHGEEYSIQHYWITFVSDLRQSGGFSPCTPVSSTNKTKLHDVIEIYLKKALNTITLTLFHLGTVLSLL